jgi:hypothetical protein
MDWVQEQLALWQRAVRDCEDEVHQAKMELAQRKMPDYTGREADTTLYEKALRRAQAKLEYAEEQVRKCKSWTVKLPKMVEEAYSGPAGRLQSFLDGELAQGMALLERQIDALERYAGLRRDLGAQLPSNPAAKPEGKG